MDSLNRQETIQVFFLSRFHLTRGGKAVRLSFRRARELLAYLVLEPGPHTREKMAALFWGDTTDARARASLRNAISVIRRACGQELLATQESTVQLNPEYPLWADVRAFYDSIKQGEWEAAVELYHGDLLPEIYEDWVDPFRAQFRIAYVKALLELVQVHRTRSEYARARQIAEQIIAVEPAHELAHQHLMFCSAASGDRAGALALYQDCVHVLEQELGVEPSPETLALYQWIKQAPSDVSSVAARITNLPIPLSSFIGRMRELRDVKELLTRARLITLTGAGGSGKTRLAIQSATDLLQSYRDGVWWVDLAALNDPALLPHAVSDALGIRETVNQSPLQALAAYLEGNQTLIVLDNCEHLILACAQLCDHLLARCLHLSILATSREALRINGETVYQVPTLRVPDRAAFSVAELALTFEGVRLFVERASQVQSDFRLTDQNARAVVEICARLDGIPLALELAAARVQTISPEDIAERLDDRFELLATGSRVALPRQQTLHALIEWSHELLNVQERLVFRRLGVFAGGFDLPAAQAVCTGDGVDANGVLNLVSRLVEKSLVVVEPNAATTRYHFLETIGAFAVEKLSAAGEQTMVLQRHADYYLAQVQSAYWRDTNFTRQLEWVKQSNVDFNNVRAAFHWFLAYAPDSALRLAAVVGWLWHGSTHFSEIYEWLRAVQTVAREDQVLAVSLEYAHAQAILGWYTALRGDMATGISMFETSIARLREGTDRRLLADILFTYSDVSIALSGAVRSELDLNETVTLYQEIGEECGHGLALVELAIMFGERGDMSKALQYVEKATHLLRASGDRWGLALIDMLLIFADANRKDFDSARARYHHSLSVFDELGDEHFTISAQSEWATLLDHHQEFANSLPIHQRVISEWWRRGNLGAVARQFECISFILCSTAAALDPAAKHQAGLKAARLLGAAEAVREKSTPMSARERTEYDAVVTALRSELEPNSLAKAWAEGRALSLQDAITMAKEVRLTIK